MRSAEHVLSVIRERGRQGLPLEDVYRQLYNPDLYLRAYGRIYRNYGAMTQGATEDTVDGMSLSRVGKLIENVRYERHRWTPVRRTHIPKKNGKTRPLGIPTWTDKLLQEVMRSILEAYYEPQFSDHSHGFRPERGCHTALTEISHTWRGTSWFIEGDIKGCFDNIDHQVLLSILREKIHDNRFLRLVENLLQAGYMEEWRYKPTLSGTPQGGIISPMLSNIYLDRLDRFVEETLLPEYTRSDRRKYHPEYVTLQHQASILRRAGKHEEAMKLDKLRRTLPSVDPNDPDYRRLRYVRYADDFLLGFAGPRSEAVDIKEKLKGFLRGTLKLELSEEKTLITNATAQAARFLGYEVVIHQCDSKRDALGRRQLNRNPALRIPARVVEERCQLYMRKGKPIHRPELLHSSDYDIVREYQSEFRGYVQYYLLAENIRWLDKLRWIMRVSMLKSLANKHKTSVRAMALKYTATTETQSGPRRCIRVTVEREGKTPLVAEYGGIPLIRQPKAVIRDKPTHRFEPRFVELIQRLLAEECEACGKVGHMEVHHIRRLADLKKKDGRPKVAWMQRMAARRRKTLVLCPECHDDLHAGRPMKWAHSV